MIETKDQELIYPNYKEPLKSVKDAGIQTLDEGEGFGYMGTIAITEDQEYIQCHICGELFKALAGGKRGHLRLVHNMGALEYKDMFSLSRKTALVSEATRLRLIKSGTKGAELTHLRNSAARERLLQYWKDVKSGKIERNVGRSSWNLERKNKTGNCPDQLIDKIKKLAEKKGRTPTWKEFREEAQASMRSIRTTFGSWQEAVKIAGLEPRKHWRETGPSMNDEQVLEAMKTFYVLHGRTPRTSDFRRGILPNERLVIRYFGDMNTARRMAGVPVLVARGGGTTRHYEEVMEDEHDTFRL